jgi:hypothetical protein
MLQKGIDVRGKACYSLAHAKVAQLVEHSTENAGVVGSIPSLGTNHPIHYASSRFSSGSRRFYSGVSYRVDSKTDSETQKPGCRWGVLLQTIHHFV